MKIPLFLSSAILATTAAVSPQAEGVEIFSDEFGMNVFWSPGSPDPESFGSSIALSDAGLMVGAYSKNHPNQNGAGSVYLFDGKGIPDSHEILPSDLTTNGGFGRSLSASGNSVLVGAMASGELEHHSAVAYLFRDFDTVTEDFSEIARLKPSEDPSDTDSNFGYTLSLSGSMAVVGSNQHTYWATEQSVAYLFRDLDTASGIVNEVAKLEPNSEDRAFEKPGFGRSVSLSGSTAIVGSPSEHTPSGNHGVAYVYRNLATSSGTIVEDAILQPSLRDSNPFQNPASHFGISTALEDGIALVGTGVWVLPGRGVYVFRDVDQASGIITEDGRLIPSDQWNAGTVFVTENEYFARIALNGGRALIGSGSFLGNGVPGAAYLYLGLDSISGDQKESVRIFPKNDYFENFGWSVAMKDDWMAMSALQGIESDTVFLLRVSAVTALDLSNTSIQLDPLGFESRIDWIIGETTDDNEIIIGEQSSATVTQPGKAIFIGKDAGSDDNRLVIGGKLRANTLVIGSPDGNSGNTLEVLSYADVEIGEIRIAPENQLIVEGDFADGS